MISTCLKSVHSGIILKKVNGSFLAVILLHIVSYSIIGFYSSIISGLDRVTISLFFKYKEIKSK